jgi:hypothetical protein
MTAQDLGKLYRDDLYVWSCRNAQLLRDGRYAEADMANVAEEIESLGNDQEHRLESQLEGLILHLLKYQYQPARRGRSWRVSIVNARIEIRRCLKRNPSLKSHIAGLLLDAYPDAVEGASAETGIAEKSFPADCPYTFQQMMDKGFLPE